MAISCRWSKENEDKRNHRGELLGTLGKDADSMYGTQLLRFAMEQCSDDPTLWILENNDGAERLYRREGFIATGRKKAITKGLDEIEFSSALKKSTDKFSGIGK